MRPREQSLGYVAADERRVRRVDAAAGTPAQVCRADKRRGEGMDAALGWPRRLAPDGLPWARWVMADGKVLGLCSRWPDGT